MYSQIVTIRLAGPGYGLRKHTLRLDVPAHLLGPKFRVLLALSFFKRLELACDARRSAIYYSAYRYE